MLKSLYLLPILATLSASCDSQLPPGYSVCTDAGGGPTPSDASANATQVMLPLTSCTTMLPKNGGAAPPMITLKTAPPHAISIDSAESCAGKTGNASYEVVCTIDKATFAISGFDASTYRITVDETHFLPTFVAGPLNIIAAGNIRIIQLGAPAGAPEVLYTTPASFTETIPPRGTLTTGGPSYRWQPPHKLTEGNLEVRFLVYLVCQATMASLADPISWTVRSITLTPVNTSCAL